MKLDKIWHSWAELGSKPHFSVSDLLFLQSSPPSSRIPPLCWQDLVLILNFFFQVSFCNFNTVFKSKETEITNRTVSCTLIASRRRKLHCSTKEKFLYLLNFIQSRKSSIKASEAGDFAQKADERIHTFPCNHLESRHPWASSCLLLLTSC